MRYLGPTLLLALHVGRILALHREVFGVPPLPREMEGFEPEPADAKDGPRAAWDAFVSRFRAENYAAVHALYGAAWRKANPVEEQTEGWRKNRAGYLSFFERAGRGRPGDDRPRLPRRAPPHRGAPGTGGRGLALLGLSYFERR